VLAQTPARVVYTRRIAADSRTKLTPDRSAPREPPGMPRALLVVVLMIAITAVLCALIYVVMLAIRPIEPRHYKNAAGAAVPTLCAEECKFKRSL
jgi:hypothetical protein